VKPSWVPGPGCWVLALGGILAACAGPRIVAVDVLTGLPVAVRTSILADGRVLAEANGYETWVGPAGARAELRPLWEARFLAPEERREPPPRPVQPCCPGTRPR
jgi:hypothetical protein